MVRGVWVSPRGCEWILSGRDHASKETRAQVGSCLPAQANNWLVPRLHFTGCVLGRLGASGGRQSGEGERPSAAPSSGVAHIHAHAHTHLTLACTTAPPQLGGKARFLPPRLLLQTIHRKTYEGLRLTWDSPSPWPLPSAVGRGFQPGLTIPYSWPLFLWAGHSRR